MQAASSSSSQSAPGPIARTMRSFFSASHTSGSVPAASAAAVVPSSLAFAHTGGGASSPPRAHPGSRDSGGSGESRGRKRGHTDQSSSAVTGTSYTSYTGSSSSHQEEDTDDGDSAMDDASSVASCATPLLTTCKLPARTLVYQLHVLHPDEKLVLSGIGGAAGVQLLMQTMREEEKQLQPRDEMHAHTDRTAPSNPGMMEEECKGGPQSAALPAAHPALEALSADLPPYSRSLFPDSLDYVRFFLSASQAHAAFLRLKQYWRAKGVGDVKERIMELQLTRATRLLVVATHTQRHHWLVSPALSANDHTMAAPTTIRRSPFSAEPSVASVSTDVPSPSAPTVPNLPTLYTPPTLSTAMRSILSEHEGDIDGYCVSAALAPADISPDAIEALELTSRNIEGGQIILRASICAQRLHLLDDDKKGRWNQQVLTDLFGRMGVDRSGHAAPAASSSRSSDLMYDADLQQAISASLNDHPTTTSAAPSFSSSTAAAGFHLAPSSFSASLQATSEQLFTNGTVGSLASGAFAAAASNSNQNSSSSDAMAM